MILVIDTALAACQAGLFRDGKALQTATEPMARGHQEALGPMVEALFAGSGTSPRDLTAIGVTLGPGSFTGLRVGLSFAKGMASALGLRLQGIGTLEALLYPRDPGGRRVLAAIDGGRGRLHVQCTDEARLSIESTELAAFAKDQGVSALTGPAAAALNDVPPGLTVVGQAWPSLAALAELTQAGGHDDVTPLYMREADAVASRRGIISLAVAAGDPA